MKKIFFCLLAAVLFACNSGEVIPPVDPPVPPTPTPSSDTSFTYRVDISSSQTAVPDGFDSLAVTVSGLPEGYDKNFNAVYSQLVFNISGDGDRIADIQSVKLTVQLSERTMCPFGQVDVDVKVDTAGEASFSHTSVLTKARVAATLTGVFSEGDYSFVAVPGDYDGYEITINYDNGDSEVISDPVFPFSTDYRGSATLPDISIEPAPDPGPGPGPEPTPSVSGHKWFELPAYSDEDNNGVDDNNPDYYYSFTYRADAAKIRNFSCCYSESKLQPVWVAAPMHSCYKGGSGRCESYQSDPQIACAQAGHWTGYTRGHMLGSSDRTVSKPTNRQVFYYSNIGAQLSAGFNTGGGAWNLLEEFVDGQWCSDTLYQVIGCIFDTWTDRYGKTVNPRTSDGSQIPTAYYKVLLRTKSGNSGKSVDECSADELKCAGFILAHRSNGSHEPCSDDLYTVAEIEALTGLTFFVNVPNAPKSTAEASDWGL